MSEEGETVNVHLPELEDGCTGYGPYFEGVQSSIELGYGEGDVEEVWVHHVESGEGEGEVEYKELHMSPETGREFALAMLAVVRIPENERRARVERIKRVIESVYSSDPDILAQTLDNAGFRLPEDED